MNVLFFLTKFFDNEIDKEKDPWPPPPPSNLAVLEKIVPKMIIIKP